MNENKQPHRLVTFALTAPNEEALQLLVESLAATVEVFCDPQLGEFGSLYKDEPFDPENPE